MLLRWGFNFAELRQRFHCLRHDLLTFLYMCHLTAAEKDADLHTILVLEKLFCLTQLGPNVFVTGFGTKSNLFVFVWAWPVLRFLFLSYLYLP